MGFIKGECYESENLFDHGSINQYKLVRREMANK